MEQLLFFITSPYQPHLSLCERGDSWRMGAGRHGNQPVIKGLKLSVPPLDLWGGERGWRPSSRVQSPIASDLIKQAYTVRPPQHPTSGVWRASSERWGAGRVAHLEGGMEALPLPTHFACASLHLAAPELNPL